MGVKAGRPQRCGLFLHALAKNVGQRNGATRFGNRGTP